jgi:TPR repeat protein
MVISEQVRQLIASGEFDQAIAILEPMAEQGDADAQFLLGYLYFGGADVEADWAHSWLVKAAAQDHAEACYSLSRWINPETSCPPEDVVHRHLLHKAADLGSAEAQYDLGALYATGEEGFPQDAHISRRYYALAAEQGNVDAQYNLGMMWLWGEGGTVDVQRGLKLLEQAASTREQQDAMSIDAAQILSDVYAQGLYGIEADSVEAERWQQRKQWLEAREFPSHPDWFYRSANADDHAG